MVSEEQNYPPLEVDQHITAQSRYYAGKIGSRFFVTLRDQRRILGSRCHTCRKVYWPPRGTCGRCFSELTEDNLVEIGPEGTLETFTRLAYREPVHPQDTPPIYGIIRLDGADTGMTHLIGGAPYETLRIGLRMEPVFAAERKGDILDIEYFRPL